MPKTPYMIPTHNIANLIARIEKINKRALKLGCPAVLLTETGKIEQKRVNTDAPGPAQYVELHEIEISGEAPKLNGWMFVATLEHASELGNVLRTVPGYEKQLPEKYRTASPENCDHCKEKRRRNDTYVLENDDGRFAQVGSTCLKDFLGYNDPSAAARYCEMLFQVGEAAEEASGWGGGGSGERLVDLVAYLSYCAAQVRLHGWVSRKKAREAQDAGRYGVIATADSAMEVMFPPKGISDALRAELRKQEPIEADREYAQKVADWCMLLKERTDLNDFMHNLKVATATGFVGGRRLGIAAAALVGYNREVEKVAADKKQRVSEGNSQYVGEIGKRLEMDVVFRGGFTYEGNFGTGFCMRFLTPEGNVIVSFAGRPLPLHEGDAVRVRGTVKRHEERKGIKQTICSRMAIVQPKGKK